MRARTYKVNSRTDHTYMPHTQGASGERRTGQGPVVRVRDVNPCRDYYAKLRKIHTIYIKQHIIVARQRKTRGHVLSCPHNFQQTRCEIMEATVRTRRLVWVGKILRISNETANSFER